MSVHRINLKEALLKEAPKKAPGKPSVTKPSDVKITEPPKPSAETIGTADGLEEVAEALANLAQPPEVAQADLAEPPEVVQKPAFTFAKPPAVPQEPAFPFAGAQPAPFASLAKRKRDVDTKAQQAKATLAQVSSAVAQERATSTHAPLPPTFGTKGPPASAGQSVGKATKKAKTSVASKKKDDTNYDSDEDAQLFGEGKLLLVCVLLRLCCGRSRNRGLLLLLLGCAGGAILIAGFGCPSYGLGVRSRARLVPHDLMLAAACHCRCLVLTLRPPPIGPRQHRRDPEREGRVEVGVGGFEHLVQHARSRPHLVVLAQYADNEASRFAIGTRREDRRVLGVMLRRVDDVVEDGPPNPNVVVEDPLELDGVLGELGEHLQRRLPHKTIAGNRDLLAAFWIAALHVRVDVVEVDPAVRRALARRQPPTGRQRLLATKSAGGRLRSHVHDSSGRGDSLL